MIWILKFFNHIAIFFTNYNIVSISRSDETIKKDVWYKCELYFKIGYDGSEIIDGLKINELKFRRSPKEQDLFEEEPRDAEERG